LKFCKNYQILDKFQTVILLGENIVFIIYSKNLHFSLFTKPFENVLKCLKFYFVKNLEKFLKNFVQIFVINFSKFFKSLCWVSFWWMRFWIWNSGDATRNFFDVSCWSKILAMPMGLGAQAHRNFEKLDQG
jgi:hypothetical protein